MSRFSNLVFLGQLFAVPLIGLFLGTAAVEFCDAVPSLRGNQFVGWSCYALVGLAEGLITAYRFPNVDDSWARFVWIAPVGACVIMFIGEYRTFPQSALSEFFVIDPYSARRGFISGLVTAPTFSTCCYSLGVWITKNLISPL